MWRKMILFAAALLPAVTAAAQTPVAADTVPEARNAEIIAAKPDKIADGNIQAIDPDKIIVGTDTIDFIIKERQIGRYDRGLRNYVYIPKGQWSFGLTASYGNFDASDINMLKYIGDIDAKGTKYTVNPYLSYFFNHNNCVGIRMGYNKAYFDLGSLEIDIDDDLNLNIKDVHYKDEYYSASIFYRHYIGLDRNKRFSIFNETDLAFGNGVGTFLRYYNGEPRETRTVTNECRLSFSPGLCVFMHEYISFNVSFGVFGVYLKNEKQKTNGEEEGSRFSSGADFKFNLFDIKFGIAVHI